MTKLSLLLKRFCGDEAFQSEHCWPQTLGYQPENASRYTIVQNDLTLLATSGWHPSVYAAGHNKVHIAQCIIEQLIFISGRHLEQCSGM